MVFKFIFLVISIGFFYPQNYLFKIETNFFSIYRRIKISGEPYSELIAVKMFFPDYFDKWDKYYFSDLVLFFSLHEILKFPPMENPREVVERTSKWLGRDREHLEDLLLKRLADELVATAQDLVSYIRHYISYYQIVNNSPDLSRLSKEMLIKISQKISNPEEITFLLFVFETIAHSLKNK
ncbi:MAG: hypothetical protein NC898_03000 [Candidatus Omnitrophica bacterium]|nr:hypothetical protein [Candidatus Omnitrophota bacterium]MCM8793417.1 hypothetical protein [Candidatus Omnitrophota bacterium]